MNRKGFTLLELLVVFAVIALLIGMLFPVLRFAKDEAKTVVCASNMRQLAFALSVYEQANEVFPHGFNDSKLGVIIPDGGYPGDPARDNMGLWWFYSLDGILQDREDMSSAVWCPSRKVRDLGLRVNILCGNYGVNRAICRDALGVTDSEFVGRPLGSKDIQHPSGTLLIADSGYSLISWYAVADTPAQRFENAMREGTFYLPGLSLNGTRSISPGLEDDAINGRHPHSTVNAVFADGHLDRISAEKLLVEEIDGKFRNQSPLWLP